MIDKFLPKINTVILFVIALSLLYIGAQLSRPSLDFRAAGDVPGFAIDKRTGDFYVKPAGGSWMKLDEFAASVDTSK